jgi:RNA polymerase-binding transcription factor DksA
MKVILILYMIYNAPAAFQPIEFASMKDCEAALTKIEKTTRHIYGVCVATGKQP